MTAPSVPAQLEAIRTERRDARGHALAWLVGIAAAGAVGGGHLVGARASLLAGICAVAASSWWELIARRAARRRRWLLDELILNGWRNVAPEEVRERESELLERRNRRVLARALESQLHERWPISPAVDLGQRTVAAELRRNRARIRALAARLRDDEHLVDPRGVVLVEHLITDGGSPFHAGPSAAIGPTLELIERVLDRAA